MPEFLSPAERYHPTPDGTALDYIYCTLGQSMSAEQAKRASDELVVDELNLKARLKLLGYYRKFREHSVETEERQKHVLWMIRNRPSDSICCKELVLFNPRLRAFNKQSLKAWEEAIEANPDNASIIGNAGCCLCVLHPNLARKYLLKSLTLNPHNLEFSACLNGIEESFVK